MAPCTLRNGQSEISLKESLDLEACQSGRMGLPAKELSRKGPQVQILSPPQLRQNATV